MFKMFKSFSRKLYATKSRNNYKNDSKKMNELCADCGYPYGVHFGLICPINSTLNNNRDAKQYLATIVPYSSPKKVRKDILRYRVFKKFLYDNDALFEFEANIRKIGFYEDQRTILNIVRKRHPKWYVNSFNWDSKFNWDCETTQKEWVDLAIEWDDLISKEPLKSLFDEVNI